MRAQRGVAVVTVLLMVSMAVIATTAMVDGQRRQIKRLSSYQALEQAQALAIAGERFAAAVLKRDTDSDAGDPVDDRAEQWATIIPPLPIAGGTFSGCIHDLNGQYNLNNLVDEEGRLVEDEYGILRRLVTGLGLPAEIAAAIADYIDSDEQPLSDGAEFEYYSTQDPPYRPANRRLASVSELRLVKGLNGADEESRAAYNLLLPYLSVLPAGSKINLNTASGPLIAALWEELQQRADELHRWSTAEGWAAFPQCPDDDDEAEGGAVLVADQGAVERSAWENVAAFVDDNVYVINEEETRMDPALQDKLAVGSDYFMIRSEIQFDEINTIQFSVLQRGEDGLTRVLNRWRGND